MAKYTKKEMKDQVIAAASAKAAGIEKFRLYAKPRNIYMEESTYGLRSLIHAGKKTKREAVDAIAPNGAKGWIVNLNGRQRKFVTAADGYQVV